MLIRPVPVWITSATRVRMAWSRQAQDGHGIPLDTPLCDGLWHGEAARLVLAGGAVLGVVPASDAPWHDGIRLACLADAAGQPRAPRLAHVREVNGALFQPLAWRSPNRGGPRHNAAVTRLRELAAGVVGRAKEAKRGRGGIRNQALAVAQAHLRVWRGVQEWTDALVGQEW